MKVNVKIEVEDNDDTVDVVNLLKAMKKVRKGIYASSVNDFIVDIEGSFLA